MNLLAPAILFILNLAIVVSGQEEITRIRLFKDPKELTAPIPSIKARDSPTIVLANGNNGGEPIAVAQSQSADLVDQLEGLGAGGNGGSQLIYGTRPCIIKCPEPIPTIPCPPPPSPPMPRLCLPPPPPEIFPPRLPILPPPPPKRPMFLPSPPLVCPPTPLCPPPQPCPPAPVCPRPAPCPPPPNPPPRPILQIPREEIPMPPPPPLPPRIRCLPPPIPALSLPPPPSPALLYRPVPPPQTAILQNDCCCNCERVCRASGRAVLASTRNRLAAAFGARIRPSAWPIGILSAENLALEEAAAAAEEAKCNSRILQKAILENISTDLESSKRRIQWAAQRAMAGTPVNVICGVAEFTFVVHAAFYCQAGGGGGGGGGGQGSCYAFTTTTATRIGGGGDAANFVAE